MERGALAARCVVCSLLLLPFYPSPVHLSLSLALCFLSLLLLWLLFFLALSPEGRSKAVDGVVELRTTGGAHMAVDWTLE